MTNGKATGTTETASRSVAKTQGNSITETTTTGESETNGENHTNSQSQSLSLSPTPLHKTRTEVQKSGKMETAITDQIAQSTHQIMSLDAQHCVISIAALHSSVQVRIVDVIDPFEEQNASTDWIEKIVARFKEKLFAWHSYFFRHAEVIDATPAAGQLPPPGIENQSPPQDDQCDDDAHPFG